MKNELSEAGLKLAVSSLSGSNYATEFLDRTIYHTVYVTDVQGNIMIDGDGNKIVRNQALYIRGAYISKPEMEYALEIENAFKDLNSMIRKQDDREGVKWKIKKQDQKVLSIQGVTNA